MVNIFLRNLCKRLYYFCENASLGVKFLSFKVKANETIMLMVKQVKKLIKYGKKDEE